MAKVSVVIPIYNVEKYVEQCIESVINQTLNDIEIICVDDGSTDASGTIADRYGQKDSRIKVIHKKNAGYGSAVNLGISMASGEYIGIVESDDFIESNMYERLCEVIENNSLDYVKCSYYEYSDTHRAAHEEQPGCDYGVVYSEYENMDKLFLTKSIWAGLYRKSFLADKGIWLLETAGASYQDTGFWFKVCVSAHRGMLIKDAFVNYRLDNDNSSVKSSQKVFCICDEIEECRRYLKNSGLRKDIILPYLSIYMYKCYQWNIGRIDETYLEEFFIKTSAEMKWASEILQFCREPLTISEWENMNIWAVAPQTCYRMLLNDKIVRRNATAYGKMLKQYICEKRLYIYGAGKVGRRIEAFINKLNPDCQIEFIVSDLTGNAGNVCLITDENINKNCKVIIAVADLRTKLEMRRCAATVGFKDIFVWDSGMDNVLRYCEMEWAGR
ncbi:MAG: glycosyltransferase [Roseburia sp.]|nr:glycosyltransferase [Roseburia sp.]